jgi:hypothetical protein
MIPRWTHQLWARLNGYFWLPCPVCGEMFGGHESGGHPAPLYLEDGRAFVVCTKPQCNYEAGARNALAGHTIVLREGGILGRDPRDWRLG